MTPHFLLYSLWNVSLSHISIKPVLPFTSKDADQPTHLQSLISAFVVRCEDSILLIIVHYKCYIQDFQTLSSFCSKAGGFVLPGLKTAAHILHRVSL